MPVRTRCGQAALSVLFVLLSGLPAGAQLRPQVTLAPTAGTVRENPKDGLKYVWIPPGTFQMGCSPGDSDCSDVEKPAHQVTISKGFWLGQTEVTVGAYKRFAGATGHPMPSAPGYTIRWPNDNMPIVFVSWDDSQAFCQWAGGRLPTEAEWEYAARAGSTKPRYGPLDEVAWYGKNSRFKGMHEVAQKRANAWGLFDTLGNVSEWVKDWFDASYYQNSPNADPPGPRNGQHRVLRGQAWGSLAGFVRVSFRFGLAPGNRSDSHGCRCVRDAGGR